MDVIIRLETLIRARVPIIVVQSHEEARVEALIKQIAFTQKKELHTWAVTTGMVQAHPLPKDGYKPDATTRDPVKAILSVIEAGKPTDTLPYGKPMLFLFRDLHPYLGKPEVVRSLRDVFSALQGRHQTVILLSPALNVPDDLKKGIAVVDFPLPTEDELQRLLDAFIDRLPDGIGVTLNGGRGRLIRNLQGLTVTEADSVLSMASIAHQALDERAIGFVLSRKQEIIKESGALEYYESGSYDEIGGLDLAKAWAREAELSYTAEAAQFGSEPPKGVLLVGVPGCGKSLIAKAIAGGNRPLLRLDVGAIFGGLVGQSEAQIRNALKVAEAVAPCVLWIDEIEKALGSGGGERDGGTSQRVLGTLLTWMEETDKPVFIVATANDIGHLRPELIQRFDEVFFVDLPDAAARREIIEIHLHKRNRDPEAFAVDALVQSTEQFSGREIEQVVKAGLRKAYASSLGQRDATTADFVNAARETVCSMTTMKEQIEGMRAWAARARPASSRQATGYHVTERAAALEF
ncbi:MAG: AAA family ATPase [Anaerolineae bacterium]|nr:AAA family ATPase [Anaerolineae bacterium]